jgi:hypothetical protein
VDPKTNGGYGSVRFSQIATARRSAGQVIAGFRFAKFERRQCRRRLMLLELGGPHFGGR